MRYVGMVIGAILSGIAHMLAFIFKNAYIEVRRFVMDPANKNTIWNMQSFTLLSVFILMFLWLVGKYQDLLYGVGDPLFISAIPFLFPCLLGHIIYSCPALYKNSYAKPIVQSILNVLSVMALGQIIMHFTDVQIGMIISILLIILTVIVSLRMTLLTPRKNTVFNKLTAAAENSKEDKSRSRTYDIKENLEDLSSIDLSKPGCLEHLRYYSEDCQLQLFNTVPTKERQGQLMGLNRSDRAQHSQIIGGTGAGKTLLATNLITQDLLNDYIGSTVIEPKGSLINRLANFLERSGRKYYRLDPQHPESDCLNPFYVPEGSEIEPIIEANVSAYHAYLGPDAVQFFKSRSTQLLRVGIKALKYAYGNDCTYNELDRLIQPMDDDYRAEVLSELREKGLEGQVSLLIEYTRNMSGSPKIQEHTMQTYSNLYDYLTELTSNKYIQKIFCGPSTFNIDDVLEKGEIVLVNGAYGTLQTLTYTVGRLYINLLRASTFRRNIKEEVRPHQLTVDEVEMFADEEFSTFMEMAREFEVFVNVIHQGNEQLSDVSKRLGAMVKQNAVQKFILAGLENEDAKYYAEMLGEEYKIGLSSGTDEMSTSGFKTQIKEEKRFNVLPAEILKLKGFNPKTGDPGECLFRGVINNIRLDPVIGLVYPLPRELFAPLAASPDSNMEELNVDFAEDNQVEVIPNDHLLKKIKAKAKALENNITITHADKMDITDKPNKGESSELLIRNSIWDDEDVEEKSVTEEVDQCEGEEVTSESQFIPAGVDNTTLKLADQIRRAAENKRNKDSTDVTKT